MSLENAIITFLIAFAIKHFVVDFILQREYQWRNKGTYGHMGGIEHATLHAFATLVILFFFTSFDIALMLALLDGVIHYHIDWAKMKLNAVTGWKPDTHPEFWWLLGLDQLLHSLTYILILYILL